MGVGRPVATLSLSALFLGGAVWFVYSQASPVSVPGGDGGLKVVEAAPDGASPVAWRPVAAAAHLHGGGRGGCACPTCGGIRNPGGRGGALVRSSGAAVGLPGMSRGAASMRGQRRGCDLPPRRPLGAPPPRPPPLRRPSRPPITHYPQADEERRSMRAGVFRDAERYAQRERALREQRDGVDVNATTPAASPRPSTLASPPGE